MVTCDDCGAEVRLRPSRVTTHGSCSRGCCPATWSAGIELACECASESARATELTSIEFNGTPPSGWG